MKKHYKKLFLCFVVFVLFMSTVNVYSYLLEDTIYIEIKSDSISKDEIEDIKKAVYNKFVKIGLLKSKNIKRATYKYKININDKQVNITNLRTNVSISKNIKLNSNINNEIYDYIFKDSKYQYESEKQYHSELYNRSEFILAGGFTALKGNIGGVGCLNLDLILDLYFFRFDFGLFNIFAFNFKLNYLFMYKEYLSPYIGSGISIIKYEEDHDEFSYKYNNNNEIVSIMFGVGIELLRHYDYKIILEVNYIFTINDITKTYHDNSTSTEIFKNNLSIFTFSFKVGFSLYSESQGFCGCLF